MLLLFPAAILVVILLGAIAVDASIVFLGQRELANAVAGAANDAATTSLSDAAFYGRGELALDETRTVAVAEAHVHRALDSSRFHDVTVAVHVDACRRIVTVSAAARVDYLFARAVPGAARQATVRSTSTAEPRTSAAPACP